MFLPLKLFKESPNMHVKALFSNSPNISQFHQISNYNSQRRVEDFLIYNALLTL